MDRLSGIITATPTPVLDTGRIDGTAVARLVDHVIAGGATALAPIGGTGEYTALTVDQRLDMLTQTLAAVGGRVPVMPGILSPGIGEALAAARAYEAAGADMLVVVTPYYARATAQGVVDYYKALSDAVALPLMLYEIPYRTGVALEAETVARLATETRVTAMKACNPSLPQQMKVVELVGAEIDVLTGEEAVFPVHMAMGARGGFLASSCILPRTWGWLYHLASSGQMAAATALHRRVLPIVDAIFREHNPVPLRAALDLMGMPHGLCLPPLTAASPETRGIMAELLPVIAALETECSAHVVAA